MFEFIYKVLETIMNLGFFSVFGLAMIAEGWIASIKKSL